MRNYLSFGGGVNSVALYLYLMDQGVDFEAVYCDHGADWPETYEYVEMFKAKYPLTIIKPNVQGFSDLYEHCWHFQMVPSFMNRWCTDKFKIRPLHKYYQKPAFEMLGIDFGERKRAKINSRDGFECRYPLIEAEIDRAGCKDIIRQHGLPIPQKSGCYFCPFQRVGQWKRLRREHPCLFQKAVELEARNLQYRKDRGKTPLYLNQYPRAPLSVIVEEDQRQIFEQDEYPPCNCGL